jgi:microsomal dipeptidase-like Zn-dependent dipeptidase
MMQMRLLGFLATTFLAVTPVLVAAQLSDEEVAAKKEALTQGIDGRTADEREADKAVMARYADAMVIDALIPGTPNGYVGGPVSGYEEMVSRSKDHGFTAVSYTAAVDDTYEPLQIVRWIGAALKYYKSKPDIYLLVDTVDDLRRAKEEGKFGVMLNFQGSNALGSRLEMVDAYYAMGVRQMNFAYNVRNFMADGGGVDPDRDSGLSKMGFQLVKEMNRVGMIVDCTHSSNQTCLDAAATSTKPIVLSHSNAYGAYELPRNSPDDVIKAVAGTGGVVCTNGLGGFLNKEGNARPEDLARHVNYVKELVGAEHTCFGSDHLTAEVYIEALDFVLRNPESYPPKLGYGAQTQIALPRDIWGVVAVLEDEYDWSEDEIRGFLGENLMRVYEANWN